MLQQRHSPTHKISVERKRSTTSSSGSALCGMALTGRVQISDKPSDSALSRAPLPTKDPQVFLHIYNLGMSGEGKVLNSVLRVVGTGAFHCGVEVYGKEWSFRGRCCIGTGVFASRPRCCENHSYSETIAMGPTALPAAEVSRLLSVLQREWPGLSYDTLRRNCCHFSDKLCRHLGVGGIPDWLMSLASAGLYLVETGNAINAGRRSLSRQFSETFSCDGRAGQEPKAIEYDAPREPGW